MDTPLMVHVVQYLATSVLRVTRTGEDIVVVTIRTDAGKPRPHNVRFTRPEAKRLLNRFSATGASK